jgi:hypothetical protein
MIESNAFTAFIRIYEYSLCERARLGANNKLTLHKALTRSVMAYDFPTGSWGRCQPFEIASYDKVLLTIGKISILHNGQRFVHF